MSSTRRLAADIDRVLKKVAEGIAEFTVIWEKVQSATTSNLKEKYEADLKKEIKKLQRYRDQIKTWASSSEVKNKKPLQDARKEIEVEMERFKVLERQTKTKAYSKEGLENAARGNKPVRRDPCEGHYNYLNDRIDEIRDQMEEVEAKQSKLGTGKLKGKNLQEFNLYKNKIEKHQYHINKLEYAIERLQKKEIVMSQVDEIKDDVEYYISDNNELDFCENEYMYDPLEEDPPSESEQESEPEPEPEPVVDEVAETKKKTKRESNKAEEKKEKRKNKEHVIPTHVPSKEQSEPKDINIHKQQNNNNNSDNIHQPLSSSSGSHNNNMNNNMNNNEQGNEKYQKEGKFSSSSITTTPSEPMSVIGPNSDHQTQTMATMMKNQQQPSEQNNNMNQHFMRQGQLLQRNMYQFDPNDKATSQQNDDTNNNNNQRSQVPRGPVTEEYNSTLKMLLPSLQYQPEPQDSERPKQYVPRNPYRTPPYFPSSPASVFEDPSVFSKFSIDTLFFIFYFQQGTPHQYLSARELKRQSWRYHKKWLTWFQRHEDPKATTDDFEKGTYVYFDFNNGWCQRIKPDFTFDYKYLEDELAVPDSSSNTPAM